MPAFVYVLGKGQGQEYSVSVRVEVLKKSMYIKLAGTRHNIQKLSDQTEYLIRAFVMRLMGS